MTPSFPEQPETDDWVIPDDQIDQNESKHEEEEIIDDGNELGNNTTGNGTCDFDLGAGGSFK